MNLWLIAGALCLLAFVIVLASRARRYGGLGASIKPSLREGRKEFASAQKAVARLQRDRQSELDEAQKNVVEAERELEQLLEPGAGPELMKLGKAALHKHSLLANGLLFPLDGMRFRMDSAGAIFNFVFMDKLGHEALVSVDTTIRRVGTDHREKRVGDSTIIESIPKLEQDFTVEQVQEFHFLLQAAIAAETTFVQDLPHLITKAKARLAIELEKEAVVAAGSEVQSELDAALAHLAEVEVRWDRSRGAIADPAAP